MFTQEINSISEPYSPRLSPSPISLQSSALEFQYQICQIFLKKTGEELHQRETKLIHENEEMLQRLVQRESDKELNSSTDSGCESGSIVIQDDISSNGGSPFKRGEGPTWRKVEGRIGVWLAEVQEKCSTLCLANIKGIIMDYRRLVEKWWEVEAYEAQLDRKSAHFQRQQQQNLLLKQKIDSQSLKLETMQCEIQCLKQKSQTILQYANKRLQEMVGNQKIVDINSKVFRDLKSYLEDKQKNAIARLTKAQALQQDLIEKLLEMLPNGACDNCCLMLRKARDSLMKFKKHLEGEGAQLQGMYAKYKKTLFSQRNVKHF